jgi:LemA protein
VETVKGYAKHEKGTFENVTKARNMAMGAEGMADKAQAENMLSSTLKTLFAVSENYPELKANENFMDLQKTMTAIEEKIQLARRYFNGTVKEFNTKIEVFPGNFLAQIFGFLKKEYFEITDEAKENVKVSFADEAPTAAPKKKTK